MFINALPLHGRASLHVGPEVAWLQRVVLSGYALFQNGL
jgi:hypothetical protein